MAQNALLGPSAPHNQKVEIHLPPSEASGCMASMKSHKEYNKGPVLSRVQRCMTQWPLSHRSGSHTPPSGWQRPRLPTPDMATCCHLRIIRATCREIVALACWPLQFPILRVECKSSQKSGVS